MLVPILALFVAVACVTLWIYGEAINHRAIRLFGSIASLVLFTAIAAGAGGLHAAFSIGIPMGEAVHAYVAVVTQQLKAGNTELVLASLDDFDKRVPITYETGAFMRDIRAETQSLRTGPHSTSSP